MFDHGVEPDIFVFCTYFIVGNADEGTYGSTARSSLREANPCRIPSTLIAFNMPSYVCVSKKDTLSLLGSTAKSRVCGVKPRYQKFTFSLLDCNK